jgi:hypothetical protein
MSEEFYVRIKLIWMKYDKKLLKNIMLNKKINGEFWYAIKKKIKGWKGRIHVDFHT